VEIFAKTHHAQDPYIEKRTNPRSSQGESERHVQKAVFDHFHQSQRVAMGFPDSGDDILRVSMIHDSSYISLQSPIEE
jgi:hypothetical protein